MPEATDNLYESTQSQSDQERDGKTDAMANAEGRPQSIEEQMLDQWRDAEVHSEVASLGVRVIEHLADGFFRLMLMNSPVICRSMKPSLRSALEAVRNLEPPVLLRLSRCRHQIQRRDLTNDPEDADKWSLLLELLAHDWDDLLNNRLKDLGTTPMSDCEVEAARDLLGQLKKQPVRTLDNERPSIVRPEIAIERDESGVMVARSLKSIPQVPFESGI